jgi:hypothetical protein
MEIRTQGCAHLTLYYTGKGLGHRDAVSHMVESEKDFTLVRLPIEALSLFELRLAQWDGAVPVELRKMALKRFNGEAIPITAAILKPRVGIKEISEVAGVTRIDPLPYAQWAEVSIDLPFQIRATKNFRRFDRLVTALIFFAAVAFLALWPTRLSQANPPLPLSPDSKNVRLMVIGLLVLGLVAGTVFELNGSSSGIYRLYADGSDPERGLLFGSPKDIRSDEWMVETPWMFSQFNHDPRLPITNGNIGDGASTLLNNLPARHWSMFFRPQMWGFFTMNFERAFAFYWNFKWFALLLGTFLFLELITRGNALLAFTGSLFLLASSFMQWWWSTPTALPEMVGMFFLSLWLIAMIFRSTTRTRVAFASLFLVAAWMQFVLCCYPRFQIPLLYLGGAMIVSGFWRSAEPARFSGFRYSCLAIALLVSISLVGLWYSEVADVIRTTGDLLYPGRTFSKGGDYPWAGLFASFLATPMGQEQYPRIFGNVCEASGFLFVVPLLMAAAIREISRRRFDPVLLIPIGFACFTIYFMTVGIPSWLATATGWSYVYAIRAPLVLGIASTIALFRYFATQTEERNLRLFWIEAALFVAIAFLLLVVFRVANTKLGDFLPAMSVTAAAIFFGLVFVCLWSRRVVAACVLLIAPLLCINASVNPLSRGLPGFTESNLFRFISERHRQDPAAKWLVLGVTPRSSAIAQFVKATGAQVVGGTRCHPDVAMLSALDPASKFTAVHHRYADVSFVPSTNKEVFFDLKFVQAYTVHLPLRSDVFDRLGVRFIVEVEMPEEEGRIAGFRMVEARGKYRLLMRDLALSQ